MKDLGKFCEIQQAGKWSRNSINQTLFWEETQSRKQKCSSERTWWNEGECQKLPFFFQGVLKL